jgi:hypothetical protein
MEEYAADDEELREKFRELRVNIRPEQKITNIVHTNEQLSKECKHLQMKIKQLRTILLSPDKQYDSIQDRQLKYDIKSKFIDYEDIQKQAMKQVPLNDMS